MIWLLLAVPLLVILWPRRVRTGTIPSSYIAKVIRNPKWRP